MKVVINRCYGGFSLSTKAVEMVMNKKGLDCFRYVQTKYNNKDGVDEFTRYNRFEAEEYMNQELSLDKLLLVYHYARDLGEKVEELVDEGFWCEKYLERDDADLVAVAEELGEKANGKTAKLKVVEIDDDMKWCIESCKGVETICKARRKNQQKKIVYKG